MADTLTIRWSGEAAELGTRLERISKRTKRPKSSYVTSAIADHIDRWEREAEMIDRLNTITDAELAAEFGWPEPTYEELKAALAIVE